MNVQPKPAASAPAEQRGIQIRNFRPADKGSVKGFFSIVVPPGMVVNNIMLHVKDGARWAQLPSREYADAQGERRWAPVVEFINRSIADRFQAAVLRALDQHLASRNGTAPEARAKGGKR